MRRRSRSAGRARSSRAARRGSACASRSRRSSATICSGGSCATRSGAPASTPAASSWTTDRPTGMTVVLSGPPTARSSPCRATIASMRGGAVDPALLRRARHVHVSSYYMQTALARRPAASCSRRSVDRGRRPSLDPELGSERSSGTAGCSTLLPAIDVFLPNATEATRIAHTSRSRGARSSARGAAGPTGRGRRSATAARSRGAGERALPGRRRCRSMRSTRPARAISSTRASSPPCSTG